MPSIVGGFVVKKDPRGLQKQPRGNVPLAWPSPIQRSNPQPRRPIRSSNESAPSTYVRISVLAKDGHYHEVVSLHVRIITKRASNSRNVTYPGVNKQQGMEGGATRVWGLESQVSGPHQSDVRAVTR